jgi:transposase InsO family protein
MDTRLNAIASWKSGRYTAKDIGRMYDVSERTIRRWKSAYRIGGVDELKPRKTGPIKPEGISKYLEQRIIRLKQKYPTWGSRRIKHQFDLPVSQMTIHRLFKKKGLMIRIKPKPQESKRFQRYHVDSMWQGDTFQFRIKEVGKVYVTGFTDDRSRFRIMSKVYLDKSAESSINALQWALRKGRIPRGIYLDNGKQFAAKVFKAEAAKYHIKLIFGKPYHPKGRGKIERYHKVLYRELIALKEFKSLSEFRRELYSFDMKYNNWRKHEILGWNTPTSVYNNKRYFNKRVRYIKKRTKTVITKRT